MPADSLEMKAYLALRKIVCFCQTDVFYKSMFQKFQQELREYVECLKALEPMLEKNITTKFKVHFLTHIRV